MPKLTDTQLHKKLDTGEIAPLYFFYGAETKLLLDAVGRIADLVGDGAFAAFNLQRFEEGCTADELQTAYEALPMMAARKAVLVRDFNFAALGKDAQQMLLSMIETPNTATVLVFYYTDRTFEPAKKAAYKKLCDAIGKQGAVCQFALKDKPTLKKALIARAKKGGAVLDAAVCDKLIDRVGLSYGELCTEVDKLVAYADGSSITLPVMEALTVQTFQNTAFDLCNAILKGQYQAAFHLLDHLYSQRVDAFALVGALAMSFGDLYRAKAGQVAGRRSGDVVQDFNYGRASFRITKHQSTLSSYPLARVRQCILSLEKANRLMITSKVDDRILLEQMLGEMLRFAS